MRQTDDRQVLIGTLTSLPKPRALFFDLDGTLVDTVHLRIEGWQRALRQSGIDVEPERIARYIGSDGRWLASEMAKAAGRQIDWAESDRIDSLSGSIFDQLNRDPQPLPCARELLSGLQRSGATFAIVTASQPGQVSVSVAALRLPSSPRIVDASHVENAKPAPDLLLEAAAQLGVPAASCWYVGDSTWDMLAAVSAGMPGIAVATGAVDAADLTVAGATVAMGDLGVLLEALRQDGLVPRG